MAIATSCCLKLPVAVAPPPKISKPNNNGVAWNNARLGSWRKQCVVGMACVIIGTEMVPVLLGGDCCVLAENMQQQEYSNAAKWSDARACPPWNMNSLELVVPENLPRPSSHRRSESIALSRVTPSNPTVRFIVSNSGNSCFSM